MDSNEVDNTGSSSESDSSSNLDGSSSEGENMHLNDDNVMNDVRDHIAGSMWLDYVNNN
ncbi:hypothetical protein D8674_026279 [Pyrus ussuriensis x Pyrus communis]|uniref:Uncharacterized protein n=1 Tax=Pyrus ussuriensis x Pyrus communis TaxID=2448454 RepID=A0A5N5I6D6_9ROSA|nr:hypothetical protein D8674_026279 [Pyrus ussuriensis x Pyrus communis]